MPPFIRKTLPAVVAAALIATLAACGPGGEPFRGQAVDPGRPAPTLEGTNWTGEPFRLEQVRGRVAVVFFGYTFCPDVCPLTLARMKQLESALGERAEEVEVVFVSVDPHRDTVEKMASYVPAFDPGFYGVRLTQDQLDAAKESFDLTVQYGQPAGGPGSDTFYYVDHTGSHFLLDRAGRLRVVHPPDATLEALEPDLLRLLDEGAADSG